jgi:hypothetical protein
MRREGAPKRMATPRCQVPPGSVFLSGGAEYKPVSGPCILDKLGYNSLV